jgi:UDP-N-acetyl-D-glucosamine dehydrogenase
MTLLLGKGALISYADPFVPSLTVAGRKLSAVELSPSSVAGFDVVVMLTDHTGFDRKMIAANAQLVVDTRNAFKGLVSEKIVRI